MSDLNTYNAVDLLRVAYRAAARVTNSQLVAEEAGERAVHRCTLAWLAGHPPRRPEAWVRVVARRTASALARNGWHQFQPLVDSGDLLAEPLPHARPSSAPVSPDFAASLPPRQRDVLTAALSCNTTKDAARTCGMQPRDFRRQLATITRKAKSQLQSPQAVPTATALLS